MVKVVVVAVAVVVVVVKLKTLLWLKSRLLDVTDIPTSNFTIFDFQRKKITFTKFLRKI